MDFPQLARKATPAALILILATVLVYWPVTGFDFLNYDDDVYVWQNPNVLGGLSDKGIGWAFTDLETGNWHPATWWSLMLDVEIYGPKPGGFHFTNLLLHLVNIVLLLYVLFRMTGALWPSVLTAALFALHPLHVESVAWIAERKDVLSTLFWLLTMLFYLRYVEKRASGRFLLVILAFTLGLMAKAMLVTLPFILLLLDYWPLGRVRFGGAGSTGDPLNRLAPAMLVKEKVPLFLITIIAGGIAMLTQRGAGAVVILEKLPFPDRLANAMTSYAAYLYKMVWPTQLAVFYPFPEHANQLVIISISLLVLVLISVLAIRLRKNEPYVLVGWLWYLGTLVPVIGLVQIGDQSMADRYTYIPLIGIFMALAWGLNRLGHKRAGLRKPLTAICTAAVLVLAVVTWFQVQKWQNSETLFRHALAVTERNPVAHNNLGMVYMDSNQPKEALPHFREAITYNPNHGIYWANLGTALLQLGRPAEAIPPFQTGLKLDPTLTRARINLGLAQAQTGKTNEALASLLAALEQDKTMPEVHFNLGLILIELGRPREAVTHFQEGLRLNPNQPQGRTYYGLALAQVGQIPEAIEQFQQALKQNPNDAQAKKYLEMAKGYLSKTSSEE